MRKPSFRTKISSFIVLCVLGVGLLASGLAFTSVALYEHNVTSKYANGITTRGRVETVKQIPGSTPPAYLAYVSYRVNKVKYVLQDLPSTLKPTVGAVRVVNYQASAPRGGRDLSQQKPNWENLLRSGAVAIAAGILATVYALVKLVRLQRFKRVGSNS